MKSNSSTGARPVSSNVSDSPKKTNPPDQMRSPSQKSSKSDSDKNESSKSAIKKSDKEKDIDRSMNDVASEVPTERTVSTSEIKKREKLKSEAEALEQLQETVETVVAGIAVMDVRFFSSVDFFFQPFLNKPFFLCVWSTGLLKTQGERRNCS